MRIPPLLADFIHARTCKPFCAKLLTLPIDYNTNRVLYVHLTPNVPICKASKKQQSHDKYTWDCCFLDNSRLFKSLYHQKIIEYTRLNQG